MDRPTESLSLNAHLHNDDCICSFQWKRSLFYPFSATLLYHLVCYPRALFSPPKKLIESST